MRGSRKSICIVAIKWHHSSVFYTCKNSCVRQTWILFSYPKYIYLLCECTCVLLCVCVHLPRYVEVRGLGIELSGSSWQQVPYLLNILATTLEHFLVPIFRAEEKNSLKIYKENFPMWQVKNCSFRGEPSSIVKNPPLQLMQNIPFAQMLLHLFRASEPRSTYIYGKRRLKKTSSNTMKQMSPMEHSVSSLHKTHPLK